MVFKPRQFHTISACYFAYMGIRYSGSMFDLHVITDADWAGNIITLSPLRAILCLQQVDPLLGNPTSKQRC